MSSRINELKNDELREELILLINSLASSHVQVQEKIKPHITFLRQLVWDLTRLEMYDEAAKEDEAAEDE